MAIFVRSVISSTIAAWEWEASPESRAHLTRENTVVLTAVPMHKNCVSSTLRIPQKSLNKEPMGNDAQLAFGGKFFRRGNFSWRSVRKICPWKFSGIKSSGFGRIFFDRINFFTGKSAWGMPGGGFVLRACPAISPCKIDSTLCV